MDRLLPPDALGPARGARAARVRTVLREAAGGDGGEARALLLALAGGPARELVLVAAHWDDDVRRAVVPRREPVRATAGLVTRTLDTALARDAARRAHRVEAWREHAVSTACAVLDREPVVGAAAAPARGSASEVALWVFDGVLGALVALRWERPDATSRLAGALGCAAALQLAATAPTRV